MATSSRGYGIPGILALARTRYEARRSALACAGTLGDAADARILGEAQSEGGVLAAGEHVNLSLWSERFDIPRPVLEAIVLALHRLEPPPPLPSEAILTDAPGDEPVTPPPPAMRHPVVVIPPSVDSVR